MSYTPPFVDSRARYVDGPHPASLEDADLLTQCEVQTGRVSGPGGQHRNKTESAVWIRHIATDLDTQATERRSQHENRRVALRRIRLKLAIRCRTITGRDNHKPSELWRRRRQGTKLPVSHDHEDYAPLLAEALDVITARRFDIAGAAAVLGVTMSQLSRLVRHEGLAFSMLNEGRESTGLPRLRS